MGEVRKKENIGKIEDFLCSGVMANGILICNLDFQGFEMHRSKGEDLFS